MVGIRHAFVSIGLVFAPLASGCVVINDDVGDVLGTNLDPKTTVGIDVVADGSGKTHVAVCASDGSLLCTELNGPYTASNGGAAVDLPFVVDYVAGDGTKVGQFEGDLSGDADNTEIAVKSKATQGSDAGSKVTLPAALVISSPAAGATLSAATDTLDLAWAPSGQTDRLEWTSAITCPSMSTMPAIQGPAVDDTGKLSIKPADLGLPAGETCEVEIILRRARDGQIETALQGHGGITAKQIRSVKVTVGP